MEYISDTVCVVAVPTSKRAPHAQLEDGGDYLTTRYFEPLCHVSKMWTFFEIPNTLEKHET